MPSSRGTPSSSASTSPHPRAARSFRHFAYRQSRPNAIGTRRNHDPPRPSTGEPPRRRFACPSPLNPGRAQPWFPREPQTRPENWETVHPPRSRHSGARPRPSPAALRDSPPVPGASGDAFTALVDTSPVGVVVLDGKTGPTPAWGSCPASRHRLPPSRPTIPRVRVGVPWTLRRALAARRGPARAPRRSLAERTAGRPTPHRLSRKLRFLRALSTGNEIEALRARRVGNLAHVP